MTASDSIRFRLALADGFLREARQDDELERWRSCVDNSQLQLLGPSQHVLTDYGDEATETLPWDLFTQDSAEQALALAERVLAETRRILTLQEESERRDSPEPSADSPSTSKRPDGQEK